MMHLKQFPWWMAKIRKIAVTNMTLPMIWWQGFWEVWANVLYPEPNKGCNKKCNQVRTCKCGENK